MKNFNSLVVPCFDGINFKFFRVGGPGLGNLLFVWARAEVIARKFNSGLVKPCWPQIKLGPILRREADFRFYGNLFCGLPSDVSEFSLWRDYRYFNKVCENNFSGEAKSICLVSGLGNQFSDICDYREYILGRLISRVKSENIKKNLQSEKRKVVSIHIRLGDFTRAVHIGKNQDSNTTTPIGWYVSLIKEISEFYPAVVFELHSDGKKSELEEVLKFKNVNWIDSTSAIDSISKIASSSALIASGSTFSRWGAYLGGVNSIYFPGQMRERIFNGKIYEEEVFDSDIDEGVMSKFLSGIF